MRTAPGVVAVLVVLLSAAPAAQAAPCAGKRACKAQTKAKKSPRPKNGTGWIDGTYNGGPGDPIIAPLPSRPGR